MYMITNGDRAVYKSLKYDRYYIRCIDDYNPGMRLFKTNDYIEALEICRQTNESWSGFEIMEVNKDG